MTAGDGLGPSTPRRWIRPGLRVAAALVPPVLVFAAVRWLFAIAAARVGYDASNPFSWRRWDSGHYLDIASRGWELFSCARLGGRPQDACGNSAWFPLYPWLLRPLLALGLRRETAGVWVSGTAALAMLVVLWNGLLRERRLKGFVVLAIAGVFPGAVYAHAIFPTSLALLCIVLAGTALARGRWVLMGLSGAALAMTYVTGVLLAVPNAVAAWWRTRALRPAVVAGGLTAAGFVSVLLAQQLILGHWDAWIRTYQKGLPGVARPLEAFLAVIAPVFTNDLPRRTIAIQALTVLGLLVLGLVTAAVTRHRRNPVRTWAALSALLFWAFPLLAGRGVSLYRADALVLPVILLLVELPVWLLLPLLLWLARVAEAMGELFFRGYLV
ncbi:MAG TPA: hypothetical protein VFD38_13190 [Myxococcaceae bacterium]|nr:hypothetical protein [Myxococcaceae bacterium]